MVSPNYIGGVRLLSEMVSPHAVQFLDRILQQGGMTIGIEAIDIPDGSALVGKTLSEAPIREAGALVVAVHQPNGDYVYNPSGGHRLEAGASLIVLADRRDARALRANLATDAVR